MSLRLRTERRRPLAAPRRRHVLAASVAALALSVPAAAPALARGAETRARVAAASPGSPAVSASPAAAVLPAAGHVVPLAAIGADDPGLPPIRQGDYRTFGVQPSGPKKPDARPNFTFRGLRPGQAFNDHVSFVNYSTKPVTLTVYPSDAINTSGGGFDLKRRTDKQTSVGTWIRMRRTSVTIPARSAFITPIEIRVPKNATPGDHAGGIVASLPSTQLDSKGNRVNVDNRTGVRFYVRIAGRLNPKLALVKREARYHPWRNPLRGKTDVTYTIRNEGNVRLQGKQSVRVTNLLGLSSYQGDTPDLPELLPGNEFSFTQTVDGVVPTFLNTAHVVVDPQSLEGNVDPALAQVEAKRSFFALSIPGLILAAGGGFWLLLAWRRRRRSKPESGPTQWGDGGTPPPAGGGDGGQPVAASPGGVPAGSGMVHRVRLTLGAVVAGLAIPALVAVAPTAAAADGSLTFLPKAATAGTPMWAVTSAPCPKGATNVLGYVYGKGLPKEGHIIVENQDPPVRHDGAFGIPLADNMANIAREKGFTLEGPYRVVIRCIDQFALKTFAEFAGTITFTSPTSYTAPAPTKPPVAGVPDGILAPEFPEFQKLIEAAGRARTAEIQEEVKASAAASAPGATPAPEPAPATVPPAVDLAAAEDDGGVFFRPTSGLVGPLIGVMIGVALLAAAGWFFTRRPQPATSAGAAPKAKGASVEWPDDDPRDPTKPRNEAVK